MVRAEPTLVVEVVYALPGEQALLALTLPRGSTIQDALDRSGIVERFPGVDFDACKVGVFGRVRSRDTLLRDGDRVEIYRPLRVAPREARRMRAQRPHSRRDGA
jgi:hypothetical protein